MLRLRRFQKEIVRQTACGTKVENIIPFKLFYSSKFLNKHIINLRISEIEGKIRECNHGASASFMSFSTINLTIVIAGAEKQSQCAIGYTCVP